MDASTSVVYRLLPQLVQRRVHNMQSLRRAMSSSSAKTTAIYDPLERPSTPTRPSTSDSDASTTPPPSYRSSRAFGRNNIPSGICTPDVGSSRQVSISYPALECGQPGQSGSGIDWKYADQGMRLLDNALQESWSAAASQSSPAFPRQLYLHACTYLLRALPPGLSAEEAVSIGNALPQPVRDDLARSYAPYDHHEMVGGPGRLPASAASPQQAPAARRSTLHRAVAFMVLRLFLIVNMLLPYVRLIFGEIYRFERKHRVSERMFSAGIQGVDIMGKRGLEFSRRVASVNDGRVGQCMNELMVWWIRGVTGGIHEGVGEGFSIVGAGAPGHPPDRRSLSRDVYEIR